MSIIKIDMDFCEQMTDVYRHPDIVSPQRPPIGSFWQRVRGAWLVLIGRADALVWP